MLIEYFQKKITYLKGAQEIALFASMANSRWYIAFGASPLFYVMLPFIGVLLTLNAVITGYHLVKANNKNVNQWLGFIASVAGTLLASISLYGAVLSKFLGVSFSIGPWFFLSSLLVGGLQQAIMFGLNLFHACEAESGSAQRKHYLQAFVNNLFNLVLLVAAMSTVVFIMLFPTVLPLVGTISAITAVALILTDIMWRILPINWKAKVKALVGLEKPADVVEPWVFKPSVNIEDESPVHHQLFMRCDYSAQIRKMGRDEAKNYLLELIEKKINTLQLKGMTCDKKTVDKIALLQHMQQVVSEESLEVLSKQEGSLAFQSFWQEVGEVERLFKAVKTFQRYCYNTISEEDKAFERDYHGTVFRSD